MNGANEPSRIASTNGMDVTWSNTNKKKNMKIQIQKKTYCMEMTVLWWVNTNAKKYKSTNTKIQKY